MGLFRDHCKLLCPQNSLNYVQECRYYVTQKKSTSTKKNSTLMLVRAMNAGFCPYGTEWRVVKCCSR